MRSKAALPVCTPLPPKRHPRAARPVRPVRARHCGAAGGLAGRARTAPAVGAPCPRAGGFRQAMPARYRRLTSRRRLRCAVSMRASHSASSESMPAFEHRNQFDAQLVAQLRARLHHRVPRRPPAIHGPAPHRHAGSSSAKPHARTAQAWPVRCHRARPRPVAVAPGRARRSAPSARPRTMPCAATGEKARCLASRRAVSSAEARFAAHNAQRAVSCATPAYGVTRLAATGRASRGRRGRRGLRAPSGRRETARLLAHFLGMAC